MFLQVFFNFDIETAVKLLKNRGRSIHPYRAANPFSETHVAVVVFSSFALTTVSFTGEQNHAHLNKEVDDIQLMGGRPSLSVAISWVATVMSLRGDRQHIPRVLLIVTNGKSRGNRHFSRTPVWTWLSPFWMDRVGS